MLSVLRWLVAVPGGVLLAYLTLHYHLTTAVMNPVLPYFVATLIFLPPLEAGAAFVAVTSLTTYRQLTAPGADLLEGASRLAVVAAIFAVISYVKWRLQQREKERIAAEGRASRLLAQDAELRAQAAEQRAHDRSAFMSAAAHELRTPLTALRGYAEIAQDTMRKTEHLIEEGIGQLKPDYLEQRQRFARVLPAIMRQTEKMERLVLLLLDVGRLEQGRLALNAQRGDLAALAREVAQATQITDPDHPIDLSGVQDSLEMVFDPLRLDQILTNLLRNAQQYSPAGSTITLALRQQGVHAVLTVSDEGPGIPVEERDAVFARFYQIGRTERSQGLGLGLYLVKMFVELHGGHVQILDGPGGRGTTVEVRLPLDPPPCDTADVGP